MGCILITLVAGYVSLDDNSHSSAFLQAAISMLFTSDINNYISITSLLLGLVVNAGASPYPSKISEPPSSAVEASKPAAQPAIAPTVQEMMKLVCNLRLGARVSE
jgi:hypothetical protein